MSCSKRTLINPGQFCDCWVRRKKPPLQAREGGVDDVTGGRKLCTGTSQNAGPVRVRQAPKERRHREAGADTPESRSSRRREERRRKKQCRCWKEV
ncbi:hypothetical protein GW17_00029945 [Ensete ventricosum]|nr:hypothetical protein GW17_00029945 [Ensete ventricosum]RZS13125.1 hypothetical protein BHM03_00044656 [Ensete ventricosum]